MRKVICKEATAGGRFDSFLDSGQSNAIRLLGRKSLYAISPKNVKDPALWQKLTVNQIKDLFEPLLVVHTSSNISTSTEMFPLPLLLK